MQKLRPILFAENPELATFLFVCPEKVKIKLCMFASSTTTRIFFLFSSQFIRVYFPTLFLFSNLLE